jgi:hypothetical protein
MVAIFQAQKRSMQADIDQHQEIFSTLHVRFRPYFPEQDKFASQALRFVTWDACCSAAGLSECATYAPDAPTWPNCSPSTRPLAQTHSKCCCACHHSLLHFCITCHFANIASPGKLPTATGHDQSARCSGRCKLSPGFPHRMSTNGLACSCRGPYGCRIKE